MENQVSFNQMLSWFLSKKSQCLDNEGEWVVNMIAKNISYSYQSLPKVKIEYKTINISMEVIDEEDYSAQDASYLQPVLKLKNFVNSHIKDNVVDFLIHGSIATLDYVKGWSDLDTLLVVNSKTIEDPISLVVFRKNLLSAHDYLLEIDTLQHHGFIFCTEFDLDHYFSHCLPIEVLQQSKSLIKNSNFKVKYNRSKLNSMKFFEDKVFTLKKAFEDGVLLHHPYKGQHLLENYGNPNAMYQMKYFLSVLMSLPILYLDALGTPCYKNESFGKIKKTFENEWEIIEKASLIRSMWSERENHPYKGNQIPEWLRKELGDLYFKRAYILGKAMLCRLSTLGINQ